MAKKPAVDTRVKINMGSEDSILQRLKQPLLSKVKRIYNKRYATLHPKLPRPHLSQFIGAVIDIGLEQLEQQENSRRK
jgi:hypothetical protein